MNDPKDVEVVLGHSRSHKFHAATLARNSTLFAELLTEWNAARLSNKVKYAGIKVRWLIELKELPNDQHPGGRMELVPLNSAGERTDGRHGLIVNENGHIPVAERTFRLYESILFTFYNSNKELAISDTNISDAIGDCFDLMSIAEYLGCMPTISKAIEYALLKYNHTLYRSIQHSPWIWVELACRLQSELLFREGIIHIVGNWRRLKQDTLAAELLRDIPRLHPIIEKYHKQLLARCKELEHIIMSLYPCGISTPSEDRPIRREAYEKDIMVWISLNFFRHWFGQRLISEQGHHAADCGFKLYKQIGTGGEAYMGRQVINQFQEKFPMTQRAFHVVDNHLLEIKTEMKGAVESSGILASNCMLDLNRYPVDYLTCTDLQREDYPWIREQQHSGLQPDHLPTSQTAQE